MEKKVDKILAELKTLKDNINKGFEWIEWRLERFERKLSNFEENLIKYKKAKDYRKKSCLK